MRKTEEILIRIFTIGFTKKNAEQFFTLLKKSGVKKLVDIRLNNRSQLAGFTKGEDLEYFLKEIAGIDYVHDLDFAPTKELLKKYREKKISWNEYETEFNQILESRMTNRKIDPNDYDLSCLLCSEPTPERCHRRLVAEYLEVILNDIKVIHL